MNKYIGAAAAAVALIWTTGASAEDLEFLLINQAPSPVVAFHVSSASSGSWENNLIAGGILDTDYEISVIIADGLDTCVYDIRADFDDGQTFEDYGLDLCELGSYTFE
jgi:fatty acid-binding protein DegV